jgi:formylglycine-generating enzyme required for sulfatase activity
MLICLGVQPGHANKRMALVIGNSAYQNVPALPNPTNDASDIAASLERLGFTVKKLANARFDEMRRALIDFGRQARGADMAVVYFAGHGMETGGENWLIPIDAELSTDLDIDSETVGLRTVTRAVSNTTQLGLVILDACRNNPFAAKMQRTSSTRSVDRGLARIEPTDNVLVAYAAKDGTTASDGNGKNSPFTAALLNNLEMPGIEVRFLFASVRDEVMASTKREQQPFVYGSLSKQSIYLKAPLAKADEAKPPITQPPAADPCAAAGDHWRSVEAIGTLAAFEDHLTRFPNCVFAGLARARIDELKKKLAVVVRPVQPATPSTAAPKPAVGVFPEAQGAAPLTSERERALKPKDVFKECAKCPEMVVVPSGSFTMGSPAKEAQRESDEGPQHTVTIAKPFAVGRFAVTFEEWDACVADGECRGYKPADQGWGRDRRPVINVSWHDAKAYVEWLGKKTGKGYRLLTEAEWEYAARAGSATAYSWGDAIGKGNANCNGCGSQWDGKQTAQVGSFAANAFGLYDMHGNAWQWVEDCFYDSYTGSPSDGSAWGDDGYCRRRVLRGGSWSGNPNGLRAAFRGADFSVRGEYNNGFRLGRTLTP